MMKGLTKCKVCKKNFRRVNITTSGIVCPKCKMKNRKVMTPKFRM